MRFFLWAAVLLGLSLALLTAYWIATQSIVVGSREGGWVYGYLHPFNWRSLIVFVLAGALSLSLLMFSDILGHRGDWLVLSAWFVGALAIQGVVCSLAPYGFERIFVHDGANSFYSVAQRFTPVTLLGDFEHARMNWPQHAQSNMPGKAVFVHALIALTTRTDVLPWLVVAVSNLGGVLLFLFVRDFLNDRRTALFSLALYFVVPGKMFFFPLLNTVTPVLVLLSAWLLLRTLKSGTVAYAACFGASIYLLALFEPLGLVTGLFFAGVVLWALARAVITWKALLWQGLGVVVGFAAVYDLMLVVFNFDLVPTARLLAAEAAAFNVTAARAYDVWVRQNLVDFLICLGVCQAVLFVPAFVDGFVRAKNGLDRWTEPIVVVVLGLVAVLATTDLIGVNRGEVVRLWIFLACVAQIPAAYVCAKLEGRVAIALVLGATLLHDALGASMIGFIIAR